jgi:hypothetical protein
VVPGSIIGRHDVAIHTGRWIIGQIGGGPGEVKKKENETGQYTNKYDDRYFPVTGWYQEPDKLFHSPSNIIGNMGELR